MLADGANLIGPARTKSQARLVGVQYSRRSSSSTIGGGGDASPSSLKLLPEQLPTSTKAAYGAGNLAESAAHFLTHFQFFYLNQVLGMRAGVVGGILFVATLADAIADPTVGSTSDRCFSCPSYGRRHPFMVVASLPMSAALLFLFLVPPSVESGGEAMLAAWCLAFSILQRVSLTAFGVPHLALGAELTDSYIERSNIRAWSQLCGALGYESLACFAWFAIFPAYPNGQRDRRAFVPITLVGAAVSLSAMLYSALGTFDRVATLRPAVVDGHSTTFRRILCDLVDVLHIANYRRLLMGLMILFFFFGSGALGLYLQTFYFRLTPRQIGLMSITGVVSQPIAFLITSWMHARLDKPTTMWLTLLVGIVFARLVVNLKLLGLAPPEASKSLVALLLACGILAGVAFGAAQITVMSCLADVADEHELRSGRRSEGMLYAARLFFGKASGGVASAAAGAYLAWIGFPIHATPGTVPEALLLRLALYEGPLMLVVALSGVCFYSQCGRSKDAPMRAQSHSITPFPPHCSPGRALACLLDLPLPPPHPLRLTCPHPARFRLWHVPSSALIADSESVWPRLVDVLGR